MADKTIHQGRNIKHIREMLGIKQDALAIELGDDWNQKKISLLEQKETIEPTILEEVAKALRVSVEAIKNFDEDKAINIFSNNYHDNSASVYNNFNPVERIIELYERLLKVKDEKIALLEKALDKK